MHYNLQLGLRANHDFEMISTHRVTKSGAPTHLVLLRDPHARTDFNGPFASL